jgi:HK97 family phage portal protein
MYGTSVIVAPGMDAAPLARVDEIDQPGSSREGARTAELAAAYETLGYGDAWRETRIDHETALTYSAVWGCVRVISQSLAGVGWHVFERSADGRSKLAIEDNERWLLDLQANPEMSAFDWRQVLLKDALTWGNGYAEIERTNAGRPAWLWRIAPARVAPVRDDSGRLWYEVDNGRGQTPSHLDPANVFHLKGLGPDGLVGYSVVQMARRTIQLGLQEEQWGCDVFGKGPMPGGVVKIPQKMNPEQRREFRRSFEEVYSGAAGRRRIIVLSDGVEFDPATLPNDDAQFLESRRFQVGEVCRFYGVPPHKLADLERATFSNIEEQEIAFVRDCLLPWARRLESEADLKLYSPVRRGRRFTRLCLDELQRGNATTQTETVAKKVASSIMTPNECREELGMNPRPGGDVLLAQGAMTTLDRVVSGQGPAGKASAGGPVATPVSPATPELIDLPDVRQEHSWDCGPAVVASVLQHLAVGPQTLAAATAALSATPERGTPPTEILALLSRLPLATASGPGMSLEDLAGHFTAGRAVLCPVQSGGVGHWLAVIGVGLGQVFVQDPLAGRRMIGEEAWLESWHDSDADGNAYERYGIAVGEDLEAAATGDAYPAARIRNEFDESKIERDDVGRFGHGGGGDHTSGSEGERDGESDADRQERERQEAQDRRDEERAKEDEKAEAARQAEDERDIAEREKEDAEQERAEQQREADREKEDAEREAEEAKADQEREREDAARDAQRGREDAERQADERRAEADREKADAGRDAKRDAEDAAIDERFDSDKIDEKQRDAEYAANQKARDREDAATGKQRDREDALREKDGERVERQREKEDAAAEKERGRQDAERERAGEKLQRERDREEKAAEREAKAREAAREARDRQTLKERDRQDAETQKKRDREDAA